MTTLLETWLSQKRRQGDLSAADFWHISQLSIYADRVVELIDGEIIEMPSSIRASVLALRLGSVILAFVEDHDLGYVTTADGGYDINEHNVFAPDVGFISKTRLPELPPDGFSPVPPDLAVEIVSPSDLKNRKDRIEKKLERYLEAGVPLIWYFYEDRKEIEVHRPSYPVQTLTVDDVLDGGDVLPGFTLALKKVFR
jgi:Uma2 family endonuclease